MRTGLLYLGFAFCLFLIGLVIWKNYEPGSVLTENVSDSSWTPVTQGRVTSPSFPKTAPQEAIVHGWVVDSEGRLQGQAVVWLEARTPPRDLFAAAQNPRTQTRTNSDGTFIFSKVSPGNYVLLASLGDTIAFDWLTAAKGDIIASTLRLQPAKTAHGVVRLRSGTPVAQALVYPVLPWVPPLPPRWTFPVRTNPQGEFWIHGLPSTVHTLLAVTESKEAAVAEMDAATSADGYTVEVRGGRFVLGRLVYEEDQRPAANVPLRVVERTYGLEYYLPRTDAEGRFRFGPVRPATYIVEILSDAAVLSTEHATLPVPEDANTPHRVEISVLRPARLRGRILDATSQAPVPAVPVLAVDAANRILRSAKSDQAGYFFFHALAPQPVRLVLDTAAYTWASAEDTDITLTAGSLTQVPDRWVTTTSTYQSRVCSASGEPVAFAEVCWAMSGDTATLRRTRTDEHGFFELTGIRTAVSLGIWAASASLASGFYGPVLVETQENPPALTLTLTEPRAALLAGQVTLPSSVAVAHVYVELDAPVPIVLGRYLTDANGSFVTTFLPAGRYRLWAAHVDDEREAGPKRTVVVNKGDKITDVSLVLP